jgi:hypothetical protein
VVWRVDDNARQWDNRKATVLVFSSCPSGMIILGQQRVDIPSS